MKSQYGTISQYHSLVSGCYVSLWPSCSFVQDGEKTFLDYVILEYTHIKRCLVGLLRRQVQYRCIVCRPCILEKPHPLPGRNSPAHYAHAIPADNESFDVGSTDSFQHNTDYTVAIFVPHPSVPCATLPLKLTIIS